MIASLLLSFLLADAAPEAVPTIQGYHRVSDQLATAGQPDEATLAQLKTLGFRTVVNLRRTSEDPIVEKEKDLVEAAGLRYVSVPLTPASLTGADVDKVMAALAEHEAGPVLLHCHSGNRAGGVWAVLVARSGGPWAQAVEEGRQAGLASPEMTEAARKVAGEGTPK